jgi:hypothetical protein
MMGILAESAITATFLPSSLPTSVGIVGTLRAKAVVVVVAAAVAVLGLVEVEKSSGFDGRRRGISL